MKKTKFTPLPWKLNDYGYGYKIEPDICWIGETSSVPPEQLRANADLLIAAPKMYKKLEKISKLFAKNAIYLDERKEIESLLCEARGEKDPQK